MAASGIQGEPAYWGGTGLIKVPNARMIEDGGLRLTLSDSYPYRNYAVTFGFFPFLELNARITEFRDEKAEGETWGGYGYHKDKAADFKILLSKESELFPALVLGVQDFHGAPGWQNFFSEYIAAGKQFGRFDLTLGYGANFFGSLFREEPTDTRELNGLFGGIEWNLRDNLSLMAEYDPVKELAMGRGAVQSPYNYGIRWRPFRWLTCGYSCQRGERHSVLFAVTYPFGKTLGGEKTDEPFYGPVDWTPLRGSLAETSLSDRLVKMRDYIEKEGFKDAQVRLSADMKTLYIRFENSRYLSHNKAAGRVLRVAAAQAPADIENMCLTLESRGIPMTEITVRRKDYIDYLNRQITAEEMASRAEITTGIQGKFFWSHREHPAQKKQLPSFSYKLEPLIIDTFLNDPSGFFRFRAGPAVALEQRFGPGTSIKSFIQFPLYSNVKTNQEPISDSPVRSDIAGYLADTGIIFESLFANRFFKTGPSRYLKLSGGYLELQYAGVAAEYLRTFRNGRFAVGFEPVWAKKRAAGSMFGLEGPLTYTQYLNLYMYAPELDAVFSAKAGRFLAGDSGVRMQVTRDIRGGKVFIWYTKTDTSGFTGENSGYSDKGVGFAIPLRVFSGADVQGHHSVVLSPWSRDPGQFVNQPYSLYDFAREFTPAYIFRHWKEFKE